MPGLSKKAYIRRSLILKWRRFLGLCVGCGAEAYGNSSCERCRARVNKATRERRLEHKQAGLCQECGKNKANSDGYRCDRCIDSMRARKEKRICSSDGCHNDAVFRRSMCQDCIDLKEAEMQSCKVHFIECVDCNQLFTSKLSNRKRCYKCTYSYNKKIDRQTYRELNGLILITKTCAYYQCNNTFETYSSNQTTCSPGCSKKMMKKNQHQRERITRSMKVSNDRYIEKVDLKVLFLRDGGRCQVCGRKLNLTRPNNHPLQATHDHIIPLSKGGENSYKNAQLACRQCNSEVKGDGASPGGDQMLLFGQLNV